MIAATSPWAVERGRVARPPARKSRFSRPPRLLHHRALHERIRAESPQHWRWGLLRPALGGVATQPHRFAHRFRTANPRAHDQPARLGARRLLLLLRGS